MRLRLVSAGLCILSIVTKQMEQIPQRMSITNILELGSRTQKS